MQPGGYFYRSWIDTAMSFKYQNQCTWGHLRWICRLSFLRSPEIVSNTQHIILEVIWDELATNLLEVIFLFFYFYLEWHNIIRIHHSVLRNANKNTRFYTLTNFGNLNNQPQDPTILEWLLKCTCPQQPCQCQAKLRPHILYILGAPNRTHTPISPSTNYTVQFIEFTYCHDRFP